MNSVNKNIVEQIAFEVAIDAAIKASECALKYWPNPLNSKLDKKLRLKITDKHKGIGNFVTIADKESEKIIIDAIQANEQLKNHQIVAEESGDIKTKSEYEWIIDPIDGTIAFTNGLPEFGVSIGLLKSKKPLLGVIAMPASGQLICARKNFGAKLISFNGKTIKQLNKKEYNPDLKKAMIGYELGYEDRKEQFNLSIAKIADQVAYMPCYGSVSASNFRLALGLLGGFLHSSPSKMDIAAAAAIIPEIGGVVTNMEGKEIDWAEPKRTFFAARSSQIHIQLLVLLRS